MTILRRSRSLLAGLRPRLVLVLALAVLMGAGAAAGTSYVLARRLLLEQVQEKAFREIQDRLDADVTQLTFPVQKFTMERIASGLNGNVLVQSPDTAVQHGLAPSAIPAELRAAVRAGNGFAFQRTLRDGHPRLLVGVALLVQGLNGQNQRSGVEVYVEQSLATTDSATGQLANSAWLVTLAVLPLAALLAIGAARTVLVPVRRLGSAARSIGEGDLDTRITVTGSDELAQLQVRFNDMADSMSHQVQELRRMERDAVRFVADVSHELRTPLAAMVAVTEVLEKESSALSGDGLAAARLISAEVTTLAALVEDLMEISRFDAGSARIRAEDVDVAEALRQSMSVRGFDAQVRMDVPPRLPARLDVRRLDVIVSNLVGNALRHGTPPVKVALRPLPGGIEITVVDRGPGIPPEVLPQVFNRFFKGDAARTRADSTGSGLGLAIVQENVRLHGGSIWAGNDQLGGARFVVRLPHQPAGQQ